REVVTEFHNATAAVEAEAAFKRQFQANEWPTEMPTYTLHEPTPILTVLLDAQLIVSKSAGRTLIAQGGLYLRPQGADGPTERITDPSAIVPAQAGVELRVGKLKFLRIVTG